MGKKGREKWNRGGGPGRRNLSDRGGVAALSQLQACPGEKRGREQAREAFDAECEALRVSAWRKTRLH